MNVLVVNCFGSSYKGIINFSSTQILLRKLFQEQKLLIDNHIQYYIREFNDLSDFIYEANSNHQLKESLKNFNTLDMIFVVGQQNLTPWDKEAQQLLILLRMSWLKEKICFISQFGMLCLLYIANLKFDQDIKIINGGGKGTALSDIFNNENYKNKKLNDDTNSYFLDNFTGDLYKFRFENLEWNYKGNIGMYLRKSAGMFHQIGNLSYRVPIHNNMKINQSERANLKLLINVIKKDHWAMKDIPAEFRSKILLDWELSTGHIVNKDKQYNSLVILFIKAMVDKNPAIISINDFSLAILFEVNPVNFETVQILKNFIKYQISNLILTRITPNLVPISAPPESSQKTKVKISVDSQIEKEFPRISVKVGKQTFSNTWRTKSNTKFKDAQADEIINQQPEEKGLKKQEIRLLLHPGISQDNQLLKQMWVPGMIPDVKPSKNLKNQAFQKYF